MDIDELPIWKRALFIYCIFGILASMLITVFNYAWIIHSMKIEKNRRSIVDKSMIPGTSPISYQSSVNSSSSHNNASSSAHYYHDSQSSMIDKSDDRSLETDSLL